MKLSSASFVRVRAVCGVALATALGCGGDFTARSGSEGGTANGGKLGGAGGGAGSGGDVDSGTAESGGVGTGGAATGGASAGGRGSGGRGSGGRGTGGVGTGGTSTGRVATGGASAGGAASGGAAGTGTGGSSTTQLASNYDQKCMYDGECTLVGQGDVCACSARCPNAAIASSAFAEWQVDRSKIVCPPVNCPAVNCISMLASCSAGTCTARRPLIIDAGHYDQTCASDNECVRIFTGEVCSSCQCSVGAVSTKGYADYLKDKASVSCSPGPSVCDCVAVGQAHCAIPTGQDRGTCAIQ